MGDIRVTKGPGTYNSTGQPMFTPTTPTGKSVNDGGVITSPVTARLQDILAIEREAAEQERERLRVRAGAEGWHDGQCPEPGKPCTCGLDDLFADPEPA